MAELKKIVDSIRSSVGGAQGDLLVARVGLKAGVNIFNISEQTPHHDELEKKIREIYEELTGKKLEIVSRNGGEKKNSFETVVNSIRTTLGGAQGALLVSRISLKVGINITKITKQTPYYDELKQKIKETYEEITGKKLEILSHAASKIKNSFEARE